MSDTVAPELGSATVPRGLAARVTGVLFAPRATYADVAARPRALGVILVVLTVLVASTMVFMSTDVGRDALLDQQRASVEAWGGTVSAAQEQRLERMAPYAQYLSAGAQIVAIPLAMLVVAGLAFAVFNALLGGDATFKQTFSVVAHSGVVVALQQIFTLPLDYARQSLSSPTNLAIFFPMLDEGTFAARLLGSIDLFRLWWLISVSIGFGVLYRRRTGPIATALLLIYAAIAVTIAAAQFAMAGAGA